MSEERDRKIIEFATSEFKKEIQTVMEELVRQTMLNAEHTTTIARQAGEIAAMRRWLTVIRGYERNCSHVAQADGMRAIAEAALRPVAAGERCGGSKYVLADEPNTWKRNKHGDGIPCPGCEDCKRPPQASGEE